MHVYSEMGNFSKDHWWDLGDENGLGTLTFYLKPFSTIQIHFLKQAGFPHLT